MRPALLRLALLSSLGLCSTNTFALSQPSFECRPEAIDGARLCRSDSAGKAIRIKQHSLYRERNVLKPQHPRYSLDEHIKKSPHLSFSSDDQDRSSDATEPSNNTQDPT